MPDEPHMPRSAIRAIMIIVGVMILLSLYANIQRLRRSRVETVVVKDVVTTPTPTVTPPGVQP